jgi:hypothetical protein
VNELSYIDPSSFEEILSENLWWSLGMIWIGPGFSKVRGVTLSRAGLMVIKDFWAGDRFISAHEAKVKFGL